LAATVAAMTANIVILQLAMLTVVLESDLGRRKIGWFRVWRPVVTIAIIVPFFFTSLPVSGRDLVLQGAGALTGALLGLASVSPAFVSVSYNPEWRRRWPRSRRQGAAVSQAGLGYAVIWVAVTVARLGFAYSAQHLFPAELGQFLATSRLSATALANAFIFLALGMSLSRCLLLEIRGRHARAAMVPADTVSVGVGGPR